MPKFSQRSKARLATCDRRLQSLFNEVIQHVDCSILEGHRDEETQDEYYADGKSKLMWPQSRHNRTPSLAVDVAPWPIDWSNADRFIYFAGIVMGIAEGMALPIRWGGDWNRNYDPSDESFLDLVHFEIDE